MGIPGQEYFACPHFNPQITWWNQAGAFVGYINRCQSLLAEGLFVADVCYYYGDHVPNFVRLKKDDPARVLPGYDYDVTNEEVLLTRMRAEDGRLVLPDGMSYRLLALPSHPGISLAALKKIVELVRAGATVVGARPSHTTGLQDYPRCDGEVQRIAAGLWGPEGAPNGNGVDRTVGSGRVVSNKSVREVLAAMVQPDFEFTGDEKETDLDYIHRTSRRAEIYFVANRKNRSEAVECSFRVSARQPEIWDPLTGRIRDAQAFRQAGERTVLPLEFAPYGSMFVLFRRPISPDRNGSAKSNFSAFKTVLEVGGSWTVQFDPKWGGPEALVTFEKLEDWTRRPEEGIRHYSGTATYSKIVYLPKLSTLLVPSGKRLYLDLGEFNNLAEVRLNDRSLGVVWARPFRVDITDAARSGPNSLEVDIVNFWPNRLIGDGKLPPEKRLTRTNVPKFYSPPEGGGEHELLPSGLLGPVLVQVAEP
jgi:hypothetical protein